MPLDIRMPIILASFLKSIMGWPPLFSLIIRLNRVTEFIREVNQKVINRTDDNPQGIGCQFQKEFFETAAENLEVFSCKECYSPVVLVFLSFISVKAAEFDLLKIGVFFELIN